MSTDEKRLWRRWVAWVTLGELVGFTVPAAVAPWATASPPVAEVGLLVAAGAVEGLVLGTAQARVLRRVLPTGAVASWAMVTSVAAAAAWLLGELPSATYDWWSDWPAAVLALLGAALGSLLLVSIGSAQWLLLRRRVARAWRWVGYSIAAWAVGLGLFFAVATPLWRPGQGPVLLALIGLLGAAVMAVTMAMVSGVGVVRLARDSQPG
jgi:uncharacterized integral membrane protein